MQKKLQHIIAAGAIACMALGIQCAIGPQHGALYTSTKFAGDINPTNDVAALKTGEACMHYVLSLGAFGEAGAGDAAMAGGISRIATIDHSAFSVLSFHGLGVYSQYCTIVAGE